METFLAVWFAKRMWLAMNNDGLPWMALPDDMRARMAGEAACMLELVGIARSDEITLSDWTAAPALLFPEKAQPETTDSAGAADSGG